MQGSSASAVNLNKDIVSPLSADNPSADGCALSDTSVASELHTSPLVTGEFPKQQASFQEDVSSRLSASATSADEELVSSDSSQCSLSDASAVADSPVLAKWHSSDEQAQSSHLDHQSGGPQPTIVDISASLETGDNLSTAAYSCANRLSNPELTTDWYLGQHSRNRFHLLNIDSYGQPGYHHFDPMLFGVDTIPTGHTDRGRFDPDQYGRDGFHRLNVDEHGEPGYHHFDPMPFGLDAMPTEQATVAASTRQLDASIHTNQHNVSPHLRESVLTAEHHLHAPRFCDSSWTLDNPDHLPYNCSQDTCGLLVQYPLGTTVQNALSIRQDQPTERSLSDQGSVAA